jgi:hypothetical protein
MKKALLLIMLLITMLMFSPSTDASINSEGPIFGLKLFRKIHKPHNKHVKMVQRRNDRFRHRFSGNLK